MFLRPDTRPQLLIPTVLKVLNVTQVLQVLTETSCTQFYATTSHNLFKKIKKKKKKLRGLSPQANYTDRATAAVGEVVPTFAGIGVLHGQRNGSPRPLISVF
jgi:hypothetical protein